MKDKGNTPSINSREQPAGPLYTIQSRGRAKTWEKDRLILAVWPITKHKY